MKKKVLIIGAGIAGIETGIGLQSLGYEVTLVEKESSIGGHIKNWYHLFPSQRPAVEVFSNLEERLQVSGATLLLNSRLDSILRTDRFIATMSDGTQLETDAVVVASGFNLFDARIKEEYGYGIYDRVTTSAELESRFHQQTPITDINGKAPRRIGMVHCVGSRDEKVGNTYCSQVCCVTAVKQAIELRKLYPQCEVFCFYMDLRMFGLQFEDLYREAQETWGVNFIRGRLSEACENIDGSIVVKVEDTLAGRPLKMNVDLLVLMVGFVPSDHQQNLAQWLNTPLNHDGFFTPSDEHLSTNTTSSPGVFLAGTSKGPKTIADTLADARATVMAVNEYFAKQVNTVIA